jgi:hypothetical protein
MEERMRFVLRRLDGEPMSELCREFGISRKTGYKIFERYEQDGFEAIRDRSRRPVRYAHQLPETLERIIVPLEISSRSSRLSTRRDRRRGTGRIPPCGFKCAKI